MNALAEVAAAGGLVWAEGDKLKYRLPKGRADLLETLRENKPAIMAELKQRTGDADVLMARCRTACRGLPVSPADLLAELNEADRAAQLDGTEGPEVLRAFAECMAERATPALDAKIERAYRWCRKELAEHPEYHRTLYTVDPDADPVLVAVAVRGIGCATLRIEKTRYKDREDELIEIWDRADVSEPATTKEAI